MRVRQIHIHQRSNNQKMCIPIKISSKVENSTCIFIGSRIRKGINQYQSINPYAKSTGNTETIEWKKGILEWKVRNSWWGELLERKWWKHSECLKIHLTEHYKIYNWEQLCISRELVWIMYYNRSFPFPFSMILPKINT